MRAVVSRIAPVIGRRLLLKVAGIGVRTHTATENLMVRSFPPIPCSLLSHRCFSIQPNFLKNH
ncbi:hypothetical protein PL8927_830008 [Planktothrix serta PCC 8927]|uniref:Uncharacterized protein n=1 Tax=Planktothrix serta PCC 8927 TaxID=671068 RepID=A0A7Z9BXJ5_9CYAN|nr:hypothetical protein PL8927_830008 [Planktothrix serta PCC 8927]